MRKQVWICLALLVVFPGLLLTASCAKKTVKADSSMTTESSAQQQAEQERARKMREAELAKQRQKEMEARQRAMEEQRLRDERMKEEQRKAEMAAQRAAAVEKEEFLTELVLFDFDSSALTPTAQERLRRKAQWLKEHPNVKIIIEGHCDERGTAEYNLALGERRAEAAKAFLVDLGVSPDRMTTISYGEERPFAKLHTEAAWAMNRRAHFVIE